MNEIYCKKCDTYFEPEDSDLDCYINGANVEVDINCPNCHKTVIFEIIKPTNWSEYQL